MKIMIRRKQIVRQAIAAETLEEEARLDAIARTSASLEVPAFIRSMIFWRSSAITCLHRHLHVSSPKTTPSYNSAVGHSNSTLLKEITSPTV